VEAEPARRSSLVGGRRARLVSFCVCSHVRISRERVLVLPRCLDDPAVPRRVEVLGRASSRLPIESVAPLGFMCEEVRYRSVGILDKLVGAQQTRSKHRL